MFAEWLPSWSNSDPTHEATVENESQTTDAEVCKAKKVALDKCRAEKEELVATFGAQNDEHNARHRANATIAKNHVEQLTTLEAQQNASKTRVAELEEQLSTLERDYKELNAEHKRALENKKSIADNAKATQSKLNEQLKTLNRNRETELKNLKEECETQRQIDRKKFNARVNRIQTSHPKASRHEAKLARERKLTATCEARKQSPEEVPGASGLHALLRQKADALGVGEDALTAAEWVAALGLGFAAGRHAKSTRNWGESLPPR